MRFILIPSGKSQEFKKIIKPEPPKPIHFEFFA